MGWLIRRLPLLLLVALCGCTTVPLTSLPALSRIDVRTTDVRVLRVALVLPSAIAPRASSVTMEAVTNTSGEGQETTTFQLNAMGGLAGPVAAPGSMSHVYLLSPDEVARFDALRSDVVARHGSIGFGIATKEFCVAGKLPVGPLPVVTYLMTSETGRYVVISRLDLRQYGRMRSALTALTPC